MLTYENFLKEEFPEIAASVSWNGDTTGQDKFGRAAFAAGQRSAVYDGVKDCLQDVGKNLAALVAPSMVATVVNQEGIRLIEEMLSKAYKQNWNDQYPELVKQLETFLEYAK